MTKQRRGSGLAGLQTWGRLKLVPPTVLTAQQREIAQCLAESQTAKEIALRLGLNIKTVEGHRVKINRALGLPSVGCRLALLTRWAVEKGLTDVPVRHGSLTEYENNTDQLTHA